MEAASAFPVSTLEKEPIPSQASSFDRCTNVSACSVMSLRWVFCQVSQDLLQILTPSRW